MGSFFQYHSVKFEKVGFYPDLFFASEGNGCTVVSLLLIELEGNTLLLFERLAVLNLGTVMVAFEASQMVNQTCK